MKKLLPALVLFFMISCQQNHAPVIETIQVTPTAGKPGAAFVLSVTASDADGDVITYNWSADGGEFIDSVHQNETRWRSPLDGSGKTFTLTVSVSDGQATTTDSHPITISSNLAPVITGVSTYPETGPGGSQFIIKILATDPDNDPLTYSWNCTEGAFTGEVNRSLIKWQSPLNLQDKTYTFGVNVSDGINHSDTVLVLNVQKSLGGNLTGHTWFTGCRVPVSGVTVTLVNQSAISDQDGYFEIKDIPFGTYPAQASKNGFTPTSLPVTIVSGSTTESMFSLTSESETGSVSGAIRDQTGTVIPNAILVMLNPDQAESLLTTTSDAQGHYRLDNLPKGTRTILTRKNDDAYTRYESITHDILVSESVVNFDIQVQTVSLVPTIYTTPEPLVSYNYARCGGTVTYDGTTSIIQRGVCWSKNPNPTLLDHFTVDGTGTGSFESQLVGLEAGTSYYVRAYASNSSGRTGYGEEQKITTASFGELVDSRDNKTYKTIEIGGQTWMAENLNYATTTGSWCYLNSSANCDTYGRLYNYDKISSAKELCPDGWTVPTIDQWNTLIELVGDQAGYRLKSISGWMNNGNGNNQFGFNAKPGGEYGSDFSGATINTTFWGLSLSQTSKVWIISLQYNSNGINSWELEVDKSAGYSVRCIKK